MSDKVITLKEYQAYKRLAEQEITDILVKFIEFCDYNTEIIEIDLQSLYTAEKGQVGFVTNLNVRLK